MPTSLKDLARHLKDFLEKTLGILVGIASYGRSAGDKKFSKALDEAASLEAACVKNALHNER